MTLLWAHPPLQTYSPCKERKKPYAQQHWWAVQRIPWKGRTKISILSSKELLNNYTDTSLMWVSLQFSHSISIPSSTPLLCRVSTLCPQTQMPHASWCTDKKGLKFMGTPPLNFLRRQFRIINNYFNMSFGESLSLTPNSVIYQSIFFSKHIQYSSPKEFSHYLLRLIVLPYHYTSKR